MSVERGSFIFLSWVKTPCAHFYVEFKTFSLNWNTVALKCCVRDFPGGLVIKKSPLGDTGSIPDVGRSHRLRSN